MKSTAKSLAKAKISKAAAPAVLPNVNAGSQCRSVLKFNADIPVYASAALGSYSAAAFVVGGGGGRAKTGVKNGLHILTPPLENPNRASSGNHLPFIDLGNLQVLNICSSNFQLYAATVESIVAFKASGGSDSSLEETCRLSLNFAKSAASIASFESASETLKDAMSKGAPVDDVQQLSRAADKALIELDSQNVVTFVHRETLHVISASGIWRIKDDGGRLVPHKLKPVSWDGHKHGRIKLVLSLNKDQFLCLCATAAGTVGVSSRQQLLVLNAADGCVAWAVPFTPAASVRITSACVLRDDIYFTTASTATGALWRCAVKTSQASQAPQLVLEFKAPAVCVAACPDRDVVVAGTADGSLHLINPNAWRRRIRQIQAHKLSTTCVAVSGGMICSASLDRTVAVASIDYEIWFSKMMLIFWVIAAVGIAFLLRCVQLI